MKSLAVASARGDGNIAAKSRERSKKLRAMQSYYHLKSMDWDRNAGLLAACFYSFLSPNSQV